MKHKSQKQQVLELLLQGHQLTKLQMLEKIGIWNGGDCIFKLRKTYDIKTRMEKHAITGKRYAVYFMEIDKHDKSHCL